MSSEQVTYNGEKFTQTLTILRINDEGKVTYAQPLPNEQTHKIELACDIERITMTGKVLFVDIGTSLMTKIIADGYTFIDIEISKVDASTDQTYKLLRRCLITDVKAINLSENLFQIDLESADWLKFNTRVEYSTGTEEKSGTEIIKELMEIENLKAETDSTVSNAKYTYITPTSYSLKDSINDILSWTVDETNSFYFLSYDHNTGKYRIDSINKLISAKSTETNNMRIVKTHDDGKVPPQGTMIIKELKNTNTIKDRLDGVNETIVYSFDEEKREMKETKLDREIIDGYFPKPWTKAHKVRFRNPPRPNQANKPIERLVDDFQYYNSYRDVFLNSETITVKTHGIIRRRPGELMFFEIPAENPSFIRLRGPWFIKRVIHVWTEDKYVNHIQVCRSEMIDELRKEPKR
jgi:hypothetical protein